MDPEKKYTPGISSRMGRGSISALSGANGNLGLMSRIQTSIASLRATSTRYHLLPSPTGFRAGSRKTLTTRKWIYGIFTTLILITLIIKVRYSVRVDPFEETPAATG